MGKVELGKRQLAEIKRMRYLLDRGGGESETHPRRRQLNRQQEGAIIAVQLVR
jgi:hypothetical protein